MKTVPGNSGTVFFFGEKWVNGNKQRLKGNKHSAKGNKQSTKGNITLVKGNKSN